LIIVVEVQWNAEKRDMTAFKNAKFWSNESHWEWATKPNPREKASSFPKTFYQCRKADNLLHKRPTADFLENQSWVFIFLQMGILMMIPILSIKTKQTIVFLC
jgi:hypothetical protein